MILHIGKGSFFRCHHQYLINCKVVLEILLCLWSNFDGGLHVKTTCKIGCPNRMGITGKGTRIVMTTYMDKVCLLAINNNGESNETTGRVQD